MTTAAPTEPRARGAFPHIVVRDPSARAGPPEPPLAARLRGAFRHVPRTVGLVWRSSPAGTIALGVLTVVGAGLPLGIAWVGKLILDAVVARSVDLTFRWVLVELGLVAATALVQRSLGLLRSTLGARLSLDINTAILDKAIQLDLRHFEDSEFYDQLTRARREASSRPLSVVTESFQLLQNVLTLAGYAALLIGFSGWAVLGLVAATIPATIAEVTFSKKAFRLRNWRSPESRRLMYLEYVLANDGHAKEVKLFGLGPTLLARYRELGETFYREDRALAGRRTVWTSGLSLLATGAFYGCYAVMAISAARGALTLGELVLYVTAFRQGQQAFQSILTAIGGMYEHNLYMTNLFSYLGIPTRAGSTSPAPAALISPSPSEGRGEAEGRAKNVAEPPPERGVVFENVGFKYPGQEAWALRNLDLEIAPGESVALVGHNGAGKSTLVKLLMRLYEPTEGRILLDGKDLTAWEQGALLRRIGVAFQDFVRYQFTFGDNVAVGSVEHAEDDDRVDRAVDRGGAGEVAGGLSGGLETQLGKWFEGGVELSGGQWQKIALSRAFMREEADILILDEPTAALDAEAEHAVFERFRTLSKGKTTLLVSHRFPTVRRADRIVVLEGGRVVEEGTHDELVSKQTRYAKLFALQAQGYL